MAAARPFAVLTAALWLGLGASAAKAASASVHYGYDANGRLVTARYDNGTCIVYTYDPANNRTSQTNTNGGVPETPTWGTGKWGCFLWTAHGAELSSPLDHLANRTPSLPKGSGR